MSRSTFHSETDLAAAYDAYADALFRHCYFRTSDREKGKELMLEAFRRAWRFIAEGNYIDDMRMFLYRAANTLILEARAVSADVAVSVAATADENQVISALQRVLPEDRDAFILSQIDEFPAHDAAEILGETPAKLASRVQRCMTALSALASHA